MMFWLRIGCLSTVGIVPNNRGGFGGVEKAPADLHKNELLSLNDWIGE
ncbi:hypothetical protein [Lysobacter gummosus]